jgi:two-component system nitrate/nitrite response regulator NarL
MNLSDATGLPIRIIILDAYSMVRMGLRLILENVPGFVVVGEGGDSAAGLELVSRENPDIILLKLNPAGGPGLEGISQLVKSCQHMRIILLTTTEDQQVCLQAIQEGVLGVVSMMQPAEVLIKAVSKVNSGEIWIEHALMAQYLKTRSPARRLVEIDPEAERLEQLSNRERQVIHLIGQGLKNQQIGSILCISESTVRHHLTSIYSKLGVADRLELLVYAHRKGLTVATDQHINPI